MSIMAILEVAIGLIFAWLVLSVAVMYIQEWIVGKLGWRSKMLEAYIGNLLTDSALAKQFYDHPLIQGLHSGFDGECKPAYIPSAQFSMALLDIISNMPKEASLIQKPLYDLQYDLTKLGGSKRKSAGVQIELTLNLARKAVSSQGGDVIVLPLLEEIKQAIRKLHDEHTALRPAVRAKIREFDKRKAQIDAVLAGLRVKNEGNPDETPVGQFREGLAAMSVVLPEVKQAVDALFKDVDGLSPDSEGVLAAVRKNLEDWFNNAMDRLSGWYKRRAQTLAFIIGLSLGILLNIDSMQFATQLWMDPLVREVLVAQASAYSTQDPSAVTTPDGQQLLAIGMQISQLNVPLGWVGAAVPTEANGAVVLDDGTKSYCTMSPKSDADTLGIRLGSQCHPIINTPKYNDPTGWLLKLIGILITGAAAAQGAPFWFDILKRVVNVRASGANSDEMAQLTVKY